jgi:hypothetical protein
MIIFDVNSWHYKLILWTWGKHFFEDAEIDMKSFYEIDSTKLEKLTWEQYPRIYKPKTVNFCPYCRALVGAVITSPFVYLYRLFPHKQRKDMTRAEIMKASKRRTFLSLIIAGGINYGLAAKYFVFGEWWAGIPSFAIGTLLIFGYWKSEAIGKFLVTLAEKWPKWKRTKKVKAPKPKKEHKTLAKIAAKHDIICPPVYFVDKSSPEEHK